MNSIYHRVSIRKYQNKPIEKEKILAILKAAMQAPSATNQQPWEFYVGKDCRIPSFAQIDLSIAMENLWLETDAQGLGGVWIGTAPLQDRMEAVKKILDLPENLEAFALFPLGYPAEEKKQQDRFEKERIHYVD